VNDQLAMHLHFERNTNAKCDCAILSLTWMGKVPDELPEVSVTLGVMIIRNVNRNVLCWMTVC
jgi:hypothetical protein